MIGNEIRVQEVQYCSIKRKLAKGLWYALGTVRRLHTFYCAILHVYIYIAALRKCRTFIIIAQLKCS